MGNLIKLQLFRTIKDKGTIIFTIITLVLGILSMVLNYFVSDLFGEGVGGLLGDLFSTSSMIQSSFSLSNTPMVLLIIIGVVLLYKESGWGTIRNQVVAGYSRFKIYFSNFLAMLIVLFAILLAHQLLTLGLGYAFGFDLGIDTTGEFWIFLKKYGLNLAIFITEIAFMTFIAMLFQNIIAPIFLVIIVPVFVASILTTAVPIIVLFNSSNAAAVIGGFEFVFWYQNTALSISGLSYEMFSTGGDLIGATLYDTSTLAFALKTIGMNAGLCGIFLGLGSYLFSRKDLK